MIGHSIWNRVDLHIHSKKSNEVKDNDYKADEYSAKELLDKLLEESIQVNLFSITDHNCINEQLYKDVDNLIKCEQYKDKINYIIGVELDVFDKDIYEDIFHCLCFFESRDVDKVKIAIDKIFDNCELSERNKKENYPSINKIFKSLNENGIQDIILIPHYNNKSKGLPSDIAIENLNYLCFNAYEDSNNITNINKSLKIYLKAGYDNFPFAVFSDCHNINHYPCEDSENFIPCYMLSNLNFPFNSIKTAFQEPRLRISLSNINNIRKIDKPENYIEKILINNRLYDLSPYQNTIIGKFGSGKSLLVEKIKNGSSSLKNHEKYDEFYSSTEIFKLYISNNPINSVNEALAINRNIKKYEFLQQEDYSFKSNLNLDEAKNLFSRININYEFVKDKDFKFNKNALVTAFNNLYLCISSSSNIYNLNYEKAFSDEEYFSIDFNDYKTNYANISTELRQDITDIELLKTKKVSSVNIFTETESKDINKVLGIVENKIEVVDYLNRSNFENELIDLINEYNQEYVNNNSKQSKSKFINDLSQLIDLIKKLNIECNEFESKYNEQIHEKSKEPNISELYNKYQISASYNNIGDYKGVIKSIVKEANRKGNLFSSILSTVYKNDAFSQNKKYNEFESVLEKYCSSITDLFKETNVVYDILCNGKSMLKRSAGEKSSLFIKLIFDLIENDLISNKNVLLILDQPESNIDNDNIYKEITGKLRRLKLNYYNFQSIIVTHNANVGITADSENIIIAKEIVDEKNIKSFEYTSGCIENDKFIIDVCDILEGGKNAMEQRTVKYGINIIKKVEKNEL